MSPKETAEFLAFVIPLFLGCIIAIVGGAKLIELIDHHKHDHHNGG